MNKLHKAALFICLIVLSWTIYVFFDHYKQTAIVANNPLGTVEIIPLDEVLVTNCLPKDNTIVPLVTFEIGIGVDTSHPDYKSFISNFDDNQIIIRDCVIGIIRSTSFADISSPNAQTILSLKMTNKLNERLNTSIVQGIYFNFLLVQ